MEVIIIMKRFQYVQDTILLLSGASVTQHRRPGERFEAETEETLRRVHKKSLLAVVSQILLALGLVKH